MFLEIHVLQNFALSNLNRDDTGAPKSCIFGGTRRARISSQSLKRAVRTHFREESLVPSEYLSFRTKMLCRELASRLQQSGMPAETAAQVAEKALEALELNLKSGRTEYLLMLGEREIDALAGICRDRADHLLADGAKKAKKDADTETPKLLLGAIDGGDAVDVALFGRMIATHATKSVDAAVQMAHAFSTHAVATEFDFFSAVDDLQKEDDDAGAGAGMLGTILYNSSCYYRYANVDLDQLATNLHGDINHVDLATAAFLEGMIHAVPSAKKTNSAPQNKPAFILLVLREKGLWSLANAFVKPIFTRRADHDLIQLSTERLAEHWSELAGLYGTGGVRYAGMATYLPEVKAAGVTQEASVPSLVQRVMQEIQAARN